MDDDSLEVLEDEDEDGENEIADVEEGNGGVDEIDPTVEHYDAEAVREIIQDLENEDADGITPFPQIMSEDINLGCISVAKASDLYFR
jgi:hypothetical protein